jgi:cytochrome c peroxidase
VAIAFGLCGLLRTDNADTADYCGFFKTPSLRNGATRNVFFHSGVFHSLGEVMQFYVERETNPAKWYPRLANGEIDRYNDLPARYKQNIDVVDAPFDRKEGNEAAPNDAEIADVIAFLKTLTDGGPNRTTPPHGRQSKPDVAPRAVPWR